MLGFLDYLGGAAVAVVVLAIAATVLAFIFIVPESKRERLNGFGKFLHKALNFKFLIIEKILQALYIFETAFLILTGVFMLFMVVPSYYGRGTWLGGYGLLIMILGPIAVRVVFEFAMMVVLLIKNVISINDKLKNQNGGDAANDVFTTPTVGEIKAAFKPEQAAVPGAQFCTKCGAKLNPDGSCPNCGQQ